MEREKVCAVLGLARAGVPAARFLVERGAQVIGYDSRPLEELGEDARDLQTLGVELRTGDHGFAGLEACTTIVLSPGLKIHHEPLKSVLAVCEARGAEVIGELELAARHCPAPIIAVTGTKGKSTTTKLIHEMLLACGQKSVRAGNTGIPLIAELPQLTPDSWAVVEVSSFQLERAPTFKPRIAVLLNLLPDHLDYHPTLEQYWQTKLKMFARQGTGDVAILNLDDPNVAALFPRSHLPAERVFGLSTRDSAHCVYQGYYLGETGEKITAEEYKSQCDEELAYLNRPGQDLEPDVIERLTQEIRSVLAWPSGLRWEAGALKVRGYSIIEESALPLRGEHNKANLTIALQAVLCVGFDEIWEMWTKDELPAALEIGAAIRNFQSLPHRLEVVADIAGVTYVNDSQATIPEAAMRALEAFPIPVALICGGRAKLDNPDAFDALGGAIAQRAALLATIGEDGPRIAGAARRAGMPESQIIEAGTLEIAVFESAKRLPAGGTVVLSPACASFDQFTSFEARGEAFRNLVNLLKISVEESHKATLVP